MRTSPEEAGCCRERSSRTHTFNYLCSDPRQAFSPKTNLQKNLERAQPVPKRSPQSRAVSSWDASHPNERPQPVSKSVPQPRLQRTSAREQLGQIFQKLDKFSPFETSSPPRLLQGKFSLILCPSPSGKLPDLRLGTSWEKQKPFLVLPPPYFWVQPLGDMQPP